MAIFCWASLQGLTGDQLLSVQEYVLHHQLDKNMVADLLDMVGELLTDANPKVRFERTAVERNELLGGQNGSCLWLPQALRVLTVVL